jgi:hypothetical protein
MKHEGKKTYAAAIVAIVGAATAMWLGEVSVADGVQLILTAIIGATLRSGIDTAADK